MSSIVFNIVLEKIIRNARLEHKGIRLREVRIGLLAYVYNIVFLGQDVEQLKLQLGKLIDRQNG